ncbi:MAG: hypothetical protein KF696_06560 [Planctomycetes bacterium]|nr:hypothetical protein [Planctomycetota bacterium]MCW8137213.1 hypothetical protein [Planctomycetota bacterium]
MLLRSARINSRLGRHVLLFGLPLVLGLACHALFNLVDTILVGQLGFIEGAQAISVTGLCDPVTTFQTILFNGPIAGAGVLLARAAGERDEVEMRRIALRATGFVLVLSAIMGVPGYFFAEDIARAMGARPGWQLAQATRYLEIMLAGGFTAGMFLYLTTLQRSVGSTNVFLAFFMLSNVLNAGLGIFLIYGTGPYPNFFPNFLKVWCDGLGLPRMGVIGSAWSTVIARALAGGLLLAFAIQQRQLRGKLYWLWPHGRKVLELMRIGMWNNGQIAARGIAGGVLIRTLQEAGGDNPSVVGGIFVGLKIELLLILLSFGWGAAAQTLVATSLGAGKPGRAAHEERMTIVYAALFGIALTVPVFVFAETIAHWFNPEPELVSWAKAYVQLMAVAFIFTPINVVISQAMVSRNRLRIPVITDSVLLLGVMSPALIIATLAGAGVKVLIVINAASVVALTIVYVLIRRVVVRQAAGG